MKGVGSPSAYLSTEVQGVGSSGAYPSKAMQGVGSPAYPSRAVQGVRSSAAYPSRAVQGVGNSSATAGIYPFKKLSKRWQSFGNRFPASKEVKSAGSYLSSKALAVLPQPLFDLPF